jgi:hypothetical protein
LVYEKEGENAGGIFLAPTKKRPYKKYYKGRLIKSWG